MPSSITTSTSRRGWPGSSRVAPRITSDAESLTVAHQEHRVDSVDLLEEDPDAVGEVSGDVLADVVGPDGQLAMAAVDHHRELYRRGPAQLGERVEGGPGGAA